MSKQLGVFFALISAAVCVHVLFATDFIQIDSFSTPFHVVDYPARDYVITRHTSDALLFIVRTTSADRLAAIYSTWANSTHWSVGHTSHPSLVRADLPPQYKTVVLVDDSTYVINYRFKETSQVSKHPLEELQAGGDPYRFLNVAAFSGLDSEDILAMHDDYYSNGRSWSRPIPRIIHQFSDRSTPLIDACKDAHPGWTHRLWTNGTDPLQVLLRFGGVFIPSGHACALPLDLVFVDTEEGFLFGEVFAVRPFSPMALLMNAVKRPISIDMIRESQRPFAVVDPASKH